MAAESARRLREILSMKEGPEVESSLYQYACQDPSEQTTVRASSWAEILKDFHKAGVDDQFIPPLVRVDASGQPVGLVKPNDVLIYFDFRTDRAKPLTASFLGIPFEGQVGGISKELQAQAPPIMLVTMTHYDDNFTKSSQLREAFNPGEPLNDTYVEVIGEKGVKQLIVAESEKWRAVTWFKDGRRNLGYSKSGEESEGLVRVDTHPTLPVVVKIVQSRKVAAHIQAPEMRAKEITDLLLDGVKSGVEDIFANYANADMVGHAMTDGALFDRVVAAITELDTQLGRVVPAALAAGYTVMITADHGNAEEMFDAKGKPNPAHSKNPVPLLILGLGEDERVDAALRADTTIADLAPTALHLRGLQHPKPWDTLSVLQAPKLKPSVNRKIMRLVLDGYGVRDSVEGNAMAAADAVKTKNGGGSLHMFRWLRGEDGALATRAEASGERCGYPKGEAGTTEFGHVLFDAGRQVRSDLMLIDHKIQSGEFYQNPALLEACAYASSKDVEMHIMGIVSDGKVHSSLEHLQALMQLLRKQGMKKVSFHVISDGRDVAGDSSPIFIQWLEEKIKEFEVGQINSIWGRGWGKDRDNRWKRIEAAYRSLVGGTAGVHVVLEKPDAKL